MGEWIKWGGSECPVSYGTVVTIELRNGSKREGQASAFNWNTEGESGDIVAYRIAETSTRTPGTWPEATKPPTAPDLLQKAAQHMLDRAATYDKPEGERSMGKTVEAFNAITGRDLTESEGWLLMQILKDVRDRARTEPHVDSLEDNIAYSALKAEARLREKVS